MPDHQANAKRDVTRAVIPAAGLGTRLRPLTYAFPKELLPVGRLPVLAHVVEELRAAGITRALFIVSNAKPQIRSYFGDQFGSDDARFPPLKCSYVVQAEQRGLGHAIGLARDWTDGDTFVVAFGDCIIESARAVSPLQRLLKHHTNHVSLATTLVEEVAVDRVSHYGIVSPMSRNNNVRNTDEAIELCDIVEKPSPVDAPSRLAVAARWVLDPIVFKFLEQSVLDPRGEINLTDAVRNLKRAGGGLWATKLASDEARRDIGNFGTFFDAFIRAAMRDPQYGYAAVSAAQDEIGKLAR